MSDATTSDAPGGEVFFAVEDGVVLGTCAAIPHAPGVLELAKFAVVPAAQADEAVALLRANGVDAYPLGEIVPGEGGVTLC